MAYPIEAVATFLIIFRDYIYKFFDIQVKVLMLIEWLHRSSPFMWTIELEKIIIFGARSPISYKNMYFLLSIFGAMPEHIPLEYRCSHKKSCPPY